MGSKSFARQFAARSYNPDFGRAMTRHTGLTGSRQSYDIGLEVASNHILMRDV
jgi:hypothetical protein